MSSWEKGAQLFTTQSRLLKTLKKKALENTVGIHAICPGLSGTLPDFDTLSRRPQKYEIVPEI